MTVEHPSARLLAAYIDDCAPGGSTIAADELWAVEAHLETCPACRDRLSAAVGTVQPAVGTAQPAVAALTAAVWSELEPQLAAVAPAPPRRLAARLSTWTTPAMTPWLAMVLVVTALALLLDRANDGPDPDRISLLLVLAPVLPVGGVAAAWSRGLDPAYELTAATPRAGLPLLLRRTAAVLAVVLPALLLGGWATGVTAAQWLLPCLAFTSTTLALGALVGVTRAAVAVAAGWLALVVAPTLAAGRTAAVLRADGLPVWGVVLALGVAVVVARRGAWTAPGEHR
ncbi:zf-HC2 domain-containing protein [Kitasatospora purpeofusca]|uniref:zf-HC2 domain-containing protein n=1 Tax=Kitasatospora purpeofusca TaxID=67352 RepID=UPI00386926FF|nr:zf-HC2 domain-containing protein [Kitasatospora purpeofusca]